MNVSLEYYSTYGPSGKIYARCVGDVQGCKIQYALLNNHQVVQSKTACDNELVALIYTASSVYKVRADIYPEHGKKFQLYSDEIIPEEYDQFPPVIVDVKPLKGHLQLVENQINHLVVKFYPGGLQQLHNESLQRVPVYCRVRHVIQFVPFLDEAACEKISKYSPELAELRHQYRVHPNIDNQQLLALANELQRLDYVEYCVLHGEQDEQSAVVEPTSVPHSPPAPANTPTPNFTEYQGYLDDGRGMRVRPLWQRGITGQGVTVHLRGNGIFPQHEDLTGLIQVSRSNDEPNLATASAGIVMARNNGFGMTGIAYDATLRSYNSPTNLADVIRDALPGDVVIIPLGVTWYVHLPVTFYSDNWDQIRGLVDAGVVVVIAAGNGSSDLRDSPFVDHGDNGVIYVADSVPATGRKTTRTNFNFRHILNAWGESVATCGYGALFPPAGTPDRVNRSYTLWFNSTAASTPQVAGVLALIQSYARNRYHRIFDNRQMYRIMVATGERAGLSDGIGFSPNAERAIAFVDDLLGRPHPSPSLPYPEWVRTRAYFAPERVSWQGRNYEAKFWDQGTEPRPLIPGKAPWEIPWELLSK